jgi:hypothetical protein
MAFDYFLLIMWGFCGVLQVTAAYNELYGLRIFAKRWKGYFAGTVITVSAFIWFFTSGNRTIEGHITGVQGAEQVGLILAGVVVSIVITALSVSILHQRSKPKLIKPGYGLEQIRNATFLQALFCIIKRKD